MKINAISDTITFEDSDIAQLSSGQQKALLVYVGTNNPAITPATFLSDMTNKQLVAAKRTFASAVAKQFDTISVALATADPATKAQAQAFIDQAAATLGVSITPVPSPVPAPSPVVLAEPLAASLTLLK